jgi:hypothetical protein
MAAIARRLLLLIAAAAWSAYADQAQDVMRAVGQISSALTDNDPSGAMTPFDKATAGYATLENEFVGLTNAYQIANEVEVLDEDDTADQSQLTLRWTLTLVNLQSSQTQQKSGEVHVRLQLQKKKWKIVAFSPVDFFTP